MTTPLVSVLCVTYNQLEFVSEALDSILAQDYPALEVILADDGSTDGTVEHLQARAAGSERRILVVTGDHVGITGNCNRGLARCAGKYIAVMGGDDVLLPSKLRLQVAWMEGDEQRVLCGHDVEVFDSDTGRTLYLWSERTPPTSGIGAEQAVQAVPFCATAIMVRRSAIPSYGFDDRIPISSDWKLWIDCLYPDGAFGYVQGVLARYRRHGRNVTGSRDPAWSRRLLAEQVRIWDIVSAEHPGLARSCRNAKEDAFLVAAKEAGARGDRSDAAKYLLQALRLRPLHASRRIVAFARRRGVSHEGRQRRGGA